MPSWRAWRPDDHNDTAIEHPIGLEAIFSIVPAIVSHRGLPASEHFGSIGEIETAFLQRRIALGRVIRDLHSYAG
ncbi:hypothetical protein AE618_17875 [Bosea vaviloviae]|uniref:Uncharacterized protein n=1 Tax=Bosea vaviloviae TaxID=1526658 RepID=A0A0N1N335_9HYPH|nr:hypothetical protein AE618_17875 [Bosea vaviloviae]